MKHKIQSGLFGVLSILVLACGATQRTDGGAGMLPVGSLSPDLTGVDQHGQSHSLVETRGSFTVVYFYPKDQTPGCTEEACAFRDVWKKYEAAGVKLFGVSKGTSADHKEFSQKHALPFPLIADDTGVWGRAFGVSTSLGMYHRVSFLIDATGGVAKVYGDVDPGVHAMQILEDIRAMSPAPASSAP